MLRLVTMKLTGRGGLPGSTAPSLNGWVIPLRRCWDNRSWKFIGEEKSSQQTVLAKLAGTLPPEQGYERTFRRKDQTTFPVLIDDRILHDAEGRIAGMRSVMQDITARKRAEEALANERALLRTLVDHLPMAIYLKDLAGRKTLANRVELDYVGATSEAEVLGKTDFDFFPPEQAAGYHAIDQEVIRTGQPVINREGSFTKPDGSVIHLLGSMVPLRDVAGRVTGLAGINLRHHRPQAGGGTAAQGYYANPLHPVFRPCDRSGRLAETGVGTGFTVSLGYSGAQ